MTGAVSIPAVYMRGGTSKGVFLHARDLPSPGPERDQLLIAIMGSPDPLQIDGMGGTYSSTSKVVVVEPGPGDAVTYWFAQIGIDRPIVDWSGNCGNLTTAVAPFAIDEGLVPAIAGTTVVRLINGNTGVEIEAEVQTDGARSLTRGEFAIAGVPGTGSPVVTRYLDPAGGVLGSLLPAGGAIAQLAGDDGPLEVSIVDAAHPNVFVRAADFGIVPGERTVAELNGDEAFLTRIERIRAQSAVLVGAAATAEAATADAPAVPRIMLVAPDPGPDADISVVAFSMGRVHRGLPMTGALCLTAAAALPGTLVSEAAGGVRSELRVRHALGVSSAIAETRAGEQPIRSLGVVRTARRLMEGRVYPREYL